MECEQFLSDIHLQQKDASKRFFSRYLTIYAPVADSGFVKRGWVDGWVLGRFRGTPCGGPGMKPQIC